MQSSVTAEDERADWSCEPCTTRRCGYGSSKQGGKNFRADTCCKRVDMHDSSSLGGCTDQVAQHVIAMTAGLVNMWVVGQPNKRRIGVHVCLSYLSCHGPVR